VDKFGNEVTLNGKKILYFITNPCDLLIDALERIGDTTPVPVPILLVKWDDNDVSEEDLRECLPSPCSRAPPSGLAPSTFSAAAPPPHSPAWTSREHRCHHSFGLALEPEEGSGPGAGAGRYVLQSSVALRAEHPTFLPNTLVYASGRDSSQSSRRFWLHCLGPDRTLLPAASVEGSVSPGWPVAVRLFDTSGPLVDVVFTRKSKLSGLSVKLVDSCENIVDLKKFSDRISNMVVKVSIVWGISNCNQLPLTLFLF
jgi:hypothetical protein